jgi:hypothetical protein
VSHATVDSIGIRAVSTGSVISSASGEHLGGQKYEAGMSKYPLGRYRNSIGTTIEMVHKKVVKKT